MNKSQVYSSVSRTYIMKRDLKDKSSIDRTERESQTSQKNKWFMYLFLLGCNKHKFVLSLSFSIDISNSFLSIYSSFCCCCFSFVSLVAVVATSCFVVVAELKQLINFSSFYCCYFSLLLKKKTTYYKDTNTNK